jgi:ribosomal protein L11 methylase PrmA
VDLRVSACSPLSVVEVPSFEDSAFLGFMSWLLVLMRSLLTNNKSWYHHHLHPPIELALTHTMPPLLYPLPTTSQVTFSSLFLDPSSSFGSALAEATAARTKLHLALKALDEKQPGASAVSVIDVGVTSLIMKTMLTSNIGSADVFALSAGNSGMPRCRSTPMEGRA